MKHGNKEGKLTNQFEQILLLRNEKHDRNLCSGVLLVVYKIVNTRNISVLFFFK